MYDGMQILCDVDKADLVREYDEGEVVFVCQLAHIVWNIFENESEFDTQTGTIPLDELLEKRKAARFRFSPPDPSGENELIPVEQVADFLHFYDVNPVHDSVNALLA